MNGVLLPPIRRVAFARLVRSPGTAAARGSSSYPSDARQRKLPASASSIQIDACSTSITLPIVETVWSPTASTERASERASENSSHAVAFSASRRADS